MMKDERRRPKTASFWVGHAHNRRMDDTERCYQALKARDSRFDGRFYTAVLSTGIFCRPTCPARTPKIQNCSFYRSAAAARAAGFRPCLRCRPDLFR